MFFEYHKAEQLAVDCQRAVGLPRRTRIPAARPVLNLTQSVTMLCLGGECVIVTAWPTKLHTSLQLQYYFNKQTATCFGHHRRIIRQCTVVQPSHCTANTLQPTGCSNYCAHITCPSLHSYVDELATILHSWDAITVGRLLYTTVHRLMMGQ